MSEQPQGKTIKQLRAIMDAENARFHMIGEIWHELTDAQQVDLVMTAQAMHDNERWSKKS